MAQVRIQDVGTFGGAAYMENTEDGPMGVIPYHAFAIGADGKEYVHLVPFRHPRDMKLERLVERIRAARVIETDHWAEAAPRISLEDRFALYAEREEMVRHGYLAEDDMYHGIH